MERRNFLKKTAIAGSAIALTFNGVQSVLASDTVKTESTPDLVTQQKEALIIIDVQNDYFPGGTMMLSGSEEACNQVQLALKHCREHGILVVHIQHVALAPTATFFLPNTFGAEIHENVKPLAEEEVIVKHFPNSFRDTELQKFLNNNEITHLTLCGMMTHMCVDATTRAAKDLGYSCTLLGDACATKDLEIFGEEVKAKEVQKSFLAGLNYYYSDVVKTAAYLSNANRRTS